MSRKLTEEVFLKDVESHEMTVLRDEGLYRHLRFASKGEYSWNQWFEIVTWPGKLAYSGDMGTYVFERIEDMFAFFRSRPKDGNEELYINTGYWAEKLQAVDRHSGYHEFSPELVRKQVKKDVDTYIDENEISAEDAKSLREAVEEEVNYNDSQAECYQSISGFSYKFGEVEYWRQPAKVIAFSDPPNRGTFNFQDIFEWEWEEYTGRYLWCCYALAWGIRMYDKRKGEEEANGKTAI
jgi:hypothetical protein